MPSDSTQADSPATRVDDHPHHHEEDDDPRLGGEVHEIPVNCPNCRELSTTYIKTQDIPHFCQVILMTTACDHCGCRNTEVKANAPIQDGGVRHTIKIDSQESLKKDLVISDHCAIQIPELELCKNGSGPGRYTTVEGLLDTMKEHIDSMKTYSDTSAPDAAASATNLSSVPEEGHQENPSSSSLNGNGSAAPHPHDLILDSIVSRLTTKIGLTLILDDPTGTSYALEPTQTEHYARSHEQNEELGFNDMLTEGYSDSQQQEEQQENLQEQEPSRSDSERRRNSIPIDEEEEGEDDVGQR